MDQPTCVGLSQSMARLSQEVDSSLGRQRSILLHQLIEIEARQEFHHVVERTIVRVAEVVDFDRVPMREFGSGADLTFESSQEPSYRLRSQA